VSALSSRVHAPQLPTRCAARLHILRHILRRVKDGVQRVDLHSVELQPRRSLARRAFLNESSEPSESTRLLSNLPISSDFSKMLSAGTYRGSRNDAPPEPAPARVRTHVPKMISQPACASCLAMAQPKPWSHKKCV
jgi:hypothetical protein